MRLRSLLWAVAITAAFVYLTSRGGESSLRRIVQPIRHTGQLWSQPAVAHTATFGADEQNNIDIYKTANTATVNISSVVYRENWFMQVYPERGQGSGFIINDKGWILTNRHVVSGRAPEIQVTLADKSQYKATILAPDDNNDLALLKIAPKHKLPYLQLGDSDRLMVGQKVIAIGNPFGFNGTLTTGAGFPVGVAVELLIFRRLYGRDHLLQVVATFGLILIFNELVRLGWGVAPQYSAVPQNLTGSV